MKSEDLYKAIGEIGEDLLARSEQQQTEGENAPDVKMQDDSKPRIR